LVVAVRIDSGKKEGIKTNGRPMPYHLAMRIMVLQRCYSGIIVVLQ
jgi:hypothetical protein